VTVSARNGGSFGAERLSIVIQNTRQLRMQKTEIRFARCCAANWTGLKLHFALRRLALPDLRPPCPA
jgi:hypothetical protein